MGAEMLLVLDLFLLCETAFNLSRIHRGSHDSSVPWILQMLNRPRQNSQSPRQSEVRPTHARRPHAAPRWPHAAPRWPQPDDEISFFATTLSTGSSMRGQSLTARDLM